MKIVFDEKTLSGFIQEAQEASAGHPILIDKFLEDAVEVDVDAIADGKTTVIGGIMEHIEEAGVHSGDSACVMPPHTLGDEISTWLGVIGIVHLGKEAPFRLESLI